MNSELHGQRIVVDFKMYLSMTLILKNTKGQNMGKKQVNVKQANISKFSLYGPHMFNTTVKL